MATVARPFFNDNYYKLEALFQSRTREYIDFLKLLNEELEHRTKPYPVDLRERVELQLGLLQAGIKTTMKQIQRTS